MSCRRPSARRAARRAVRNCLPRLSGNIIASRSPPPAPCLRCGMGGAARRGSARSGRRAPRTFRCLEIAGWLMAEGLTPSPMRRRKQAAPGSPAASGRQGRRRLRGADPRRSFYNRSVVKLDGYIMRPLGRSSADSSVGSRCCSVAQTIAKPPLDSLPCPPYLLPPRTGRRAMAARNPQSSIFCLRWRSSPPASSPSPSSSGSASAR